MDDRLEQHRTQSEIARVRYARLASEFGVESLYALAGLADPGQVLLLLTEAASCSGGSCSTLSAIRSEVEEAKTRGAVQAVVVDWDPIDQGLGNWILIGVGPGALKETAIGGSSGEWTARLIVMELVDDMVSEADILD